MKLLYLSCKSVKSWPESADLSVFVQRCWGKLVALLGYNINSMEITIPRTEVSYPLHLLYLWGGAYYKPHPFEVDRQDEGYQPSHSPSTSVLQTPTDGPVRVLESLGPKLRDPTHLIPREQGRINLVGYPDEQVERTPHPIDLMHVTSSIASGRRVSWIRHFEWLGGGKQ